MAVSSEKNTCNLINPNKGVRQKSFFKEIIFQSLQIWWKLKPETHDMEIFDGWKVMWILEFQAAFLCSFHNFWAYLIDGGSFKS